MKHTRTRLTSADGWDIPFVLALMTVVLIGPILLLALLMTVSIFFIAVGVPLAVFSGLPVWHVTKAHKVRLHPALFVIPFGALEVALGMQVLESLDPGDQALGSSMVFFGLATLTTGAAIAILAKSRTRFVPPPTAQTRTTAWPPAASPTMQPIAPSAAPPTPRP